MELLKKTGFILICVYLVFVFLPDSVRAGISSTLDPAKTINENDIKQIYKNLLSVSGFTSEAQGFPELVIVPGDNPKLAYFNGTQIVIFQKTIEQLNDKDMIAAILAHELSHFMRGDGQVEVTDVVSAVHEAGADQLSTYFILRAGYDPCKMKQVWIKYRDMSGDYMTNENHPSNSYRIWQFSFPQCR